MRRNTERCSWCLKCVKAGMRKGSAHPAARNVRGGMPIKGDRGQRTEDRERDTPCQENLKQKNERGNRGQRSWDGSARDV